MVAKAIKSMKQFMAGVLLGILLNPSKEGFLKGFILLPKMIFDEVTGMSQVIDISLIPYDRIPYPVHSGFVYQSGLIPVLLPSIDDPIHREQAFAMLCDRLLAGNLIGAQGGEEWYALTDLKRSGDAVAFIGSYEKMSEVMGAPLYELKDPIKSFKVLLPPSRLHIKETSGLAMPGHVRIALAKLDSIKTDGGIISKVGLMHSDYAKEGEKVGPPRYVKYSYQIRHNTIRFMSGHKKGKVTYDPALHRLLCRRAGIDHRLCDMIMAEDNIKSATTHKAGDIITVPVGELRVIKLKERQSPTRGGAQIRRIAWPALKELIAEKAASNIAAATVMKFASKGDAHAIAHILQVPFTPIDPPREELKQALAVLANTINKDSKQYFEDGLGLFIQLLAAAKWVVGKEGGYWQVPMYGDPFSAVMGRLRAWYFDRVIKLQLGDFSFYVEVAPHLKGAECILPNNRDLLDIAEHSEISFTGMRPPIVSRGNLQPLHPKRKNNGKGAIKVNRTDDTIYVSPELLLSMFGDTDGDMLYIIHSHTKFRLRIRNVVEEPKFKYLASNPNELCNLIKLKCSQVAQASLEVGLRDRAASIIYDERQMDGHPITDGESVKMADEWLENSIKSFKHDGTSIMGDAAIELMCLEYGTDAIRKTRTLPKKPLPQTQLFRRKIGAFGPKSGSDKVKMKSLSFELERFYKHKPNVTNGVCKPGANQHPYLPIFDALRGFTYAEDMERVKADHVAFTKFWDRCKDFLDLQNPRLKFMIIDVVKHIEDLYNSGASYAITLSSYNGAEPAPWWPFCIYHDVKFRRDWADHIWNSGMVFTFDKISPKGYKNTMRGVVTREEVYEMLATGRINTKQKRARFSALREQIDAYIVSSIQNLQLHVRLPEKELHKFIAAALAYRVFGMRKDGTGARNAREFMSVNDDIKLSVYNLVFESPWGVIARKIWDSMEAYYHDIEDSMPVVDPDEEDEGM